MEESRYGAYCELIALPLRIEGWSKIKTMLEGELESKRRKVDKTCTMLSWEEANKLIELIKNEGEVYHIGKVDLFENDWGITSLDTNLKWDYE